jgi:hypothetical protein
MVTAQRFSLVLLSSIVLGQSYLLMADTEARTLFPVARGQQWGYADRSGNLVIPASFAGAQDFHDGFAIVVTKFDPRSRVSVFRFVKPDGNLLPTEDFGDVSQFSEGLAAVRGSGGLFGYIDRTGTLVIPPRYTRASDFSEGLAAVQTADGYVFIDRSGKIVMLSSFTDARPFSQGVAAVMFKDRKYSNGQYSHIDRQGTVVFDPIDQTANKLQCHRLSEGLAPVTQHGKVGFVNSTGEVKIDFLFDDAGCFSNGLAWVLKGGKYGFIDKLGNWAIEPQFTGARDFAEGLAPVQRIESGNVVWGYVDAQGHEQVPAIFTEAQSFYGGSATIEDSVYGMRGYIDKQGQIFNRFRTPERECVGCTSPPMSMFELTLHSKPTGAIVYLVPRYHYETHPSIKGKDGDLANFRLPYGKTDVTCSNGCVKDQVYMAVYTLNNLRCNMLIDIRPEITNSFTFIIDKDDPACK